MHGYVLGEKLPLYTEACIKKRATDSRFGRGRGAGSTNGIHTFRQTPHFPAAVCVRGVGMAWAENLRFSMPEMSAESISLLEVQLLRGHVVEAAEASIHLLQTLGREAGADLPSDLLVRLLYVALQALFMLERCG